MYVFYRGYEVIEHYQDGRYTYHASNGSVSVTVGVSKRMTQSEVEAWIDLIIKIQESG